MFAKFMSMMSWISPQLKWIEHLNNKQVVHPPVSEFLFDDCVLPKEIAQ